MNGNLVGRGSRKSYPSNEAAVIHPPSDAVTPINAPSHSLSLGHGSARNLNQQPDSAVRYSGPPHELSVAWEPRPTKLTISLSPFTVHLSRSDDSRQHPVSSPAAHIFNVLRAPRLWLEHSPRSQQPP